MNIILVCQCIGNTLNIVIPTSCSGTLNISVSSIRNSPTTSTVIGFYIFTGFLDGYIEQSTSMSVSVSSPSLINLSNFYTAGSTQIATTGDYYFKFTCNSPIPQYSSILITFPNEFSLLKVSGFVPIFGLSSCTYSINSLTFNISGGFSTGYLAENTSIMFSIINLMNPVSTKPSSSITIMVYDQYSGKVAYIGSGLSITATPGTLSQVVINSMSSTIGVSTIYSFSFSPQHSLPSGSAILITFPAEVYSTNTNGTCFYVPQTSGLSSAAQCNITQNQFL